MAALQERNGSFRILFRHHGKQSAFKLGKVSREEAEATVGCVDLLLLRLGQRLISLPPGVDLVTFLRHGGSVPATGEEPAVTAAAPTLGSLRDEYLKTHSSSLEATTL